MHDLNNIKILHINTHGRGGAFTGAYRLHLALLKSGIKSKMLVRDDISKNSQLKEVYTFNKPFRRTNLINRVFTRLGFPYTAHQKSWIISQKLEGKFKEISFPISDFDITQSKEYMEADIIHLHWIANYIDYKSFFKKCTKPIIITLRDLFPLQGISHYTENAGKNQTIYPHIDSKMAEIKKEAFWHTKAPVAIVGISKWITEKSIQSKIHKNLPHNTIHNCIDIQQYKLFKKKDLQKEFNITNKKIVFSFISDGTLIYRKGIDLLFDAISQLNETSNIIIFTAGKGTPPDLPGKINHRHLGPLQNNELNKLYCLSDALIFPSREEALGNVMLEAMACGTPVIGTPVGGLLDVIRPGFNGLLAKDISAEGLKNSIEEFIRIKDTFDSNNIREYIQNNFSEELVASKYIQLYTEIIKS